MNRTEQKHQAILNAAKQEFTKCGFAGANIDTICELADVSKRTLYRHFENKEGLFEAVLAQIQAVAAARAHYVYDPMRSITSQLHYIVTEEVDILYQNYGLELARIIVMEFLRHPQLAQQMADKLYSNDAVKRWFSQAITVNMLANHNLDEVIVIYSSLFYGQLFWPHIFGSSPIPTQAELEHRVDNLVTHLVKLLT